MPRSLLCVHGYEVLPGPRGAVLGSFAEAVCERAAEIHSAYDAIVLLGGWDNPEVPSEITIAGVMKKRLVELGVPGNKLVLPMECGCMDGVLPARCTAEEVICCQEWRLRQPGEESEIDVLCVANWLPRIRRLYQNTWTRVNRFEAVVVPVPRSAMVREWVLRLLSVVDPFGTGLLTGIPFKLNRRKRSANRGVGDETSLVRQMLLHAPQFDLLTGGRR